MTCTQLHAYTHTHTVNLSSFITVRCNAVHLLSFHKKPPTVTAQQITLPITGPFTHTHSSFLQPPMILIHTSLQRQATVILAKTLFHANFCWSQRQKQLLKPPLKLIIMFLLNIAVFIIIIYLCTLFFNSDALVMFNLHNLPSVSTSLYTSRMRAGQLVTHMKSQQQQTTTIQSIPDEQN